MYINKEIENINLIKYLMSNYKLVKDGEILHSVNINVTEFTIPDTVNKIGLYAFKDCVKLKNIIIPNKINIIENNAFNNCRSLTSINVSKNIKISDFVFNDCINLKNANLLNVDYIEVGTFCNCINLTTLNIPKVNSIGYMAFAGCDSLTNIISSLSEYQLSWAFGSKEQYNKYLIRKRDCKINQIL